MAVISIVVGNLLALIQTNIKRMMGYSSISHFGYLLAVVVASRLGQIPVEAAGVYLLMYLFTSLGAFGVIGMMSSPYRGKGCGLPAGYRGLFWKRPYLTAVMTVMMLSLAGIPMTLGFIGKFLPHPGVTVEAQLWWLSGAIVLGGALGLYYYLRVAGHPLPAGNPACSCAMPEGRLGLLLRGPGGAALRHPGGIARHLPPARHQSGAGLPAWCCVKPQAHQQNRPRGRFFIPIPRRYSSCSGAGNVRPPRFPLAIQGLKHRGCYMPSPESGSFTPTLMLRP